ncbi:DUF3307 domain-containing protein [Candidatus Formimonas warabiya]|uniref:DUF3307 domain-containing protein n=1 Tax=Formimonas warabiya TaxID=1761012 RepID=A0A3G1KWU1_FORW1|nr:DUF3307 domain-containing protein [Candidatus Formimonas warabiya]ATW26944.1 hypothetical protein DCMF_21225 [Candidatus Formimonas warabiya]
MDISILLCLILAHVTADFLLQREAIIDLRFHSRRKTRFCGNALHAGIYFCLSFAFTLPWFSLPLMGTVGLAAIIHLIIDMTKSELVMMNPERRHHLWLFLGDQTVHLICLFILWVVLVKGDMQGLLRFLERYAICADITAPKILLILLLFVVGIWGVGHFIKIYSSWLRYCAQKRESKEGKEREAVLENEVQKGVYEGGFMIGLLERAFIIISLAYGLPNEVIGFALATKSIARFKRFDDDTFVEYFIIGTFISFISAIIVGMLILKILHSPT